MGDGLRKANREIDRASIIPENEGIASGLTKHHVQRAKKYGGGFFVNVEGLHHLHCLVRYVWILVTSI